MRHWRIVDYVTHFSQATELHCKETVALRQLVSETQTSAGRLKIDAFRSDNDIESTA